jgi:hypothetical protein
MLLKQMRRVLSHADFYQLMLLGLARLYLMWGANAEMNIYKWLPIVLIRGKETFLVFDGVMHIRCLWKTKF